MLVYLVGRFDSPTKQRAALKGLQELAGNPTAAVSSTVLCFAVFNSLQTWITWHQECWVLLYPDTSIILIVTQQDCHSECYSCQHKLRSTLLLNWLFDAQEVKTYTESQWSPNRNQQLTNSKESCLQDWSSLSSVSFSARFDCFSYAAHALVSLKPCPEIKAMKYQVHGFQAILIETQTTPPWHSVEWDYWLSKTTCVALSAGASGAVRGSANTCSSSETECTSPEDVGCSDSEALRGRISWMSKIHWGIRGNSRVGEIGRSCQEMVCKSCWKEAAGMNPSNLSFYDLISVNSIIIKVSNNNHNNNNER